MSKAQVITELISDQKYIFESVHKYTSFINNLFKTQIGEKFYIESIPNGLVYFYADCRIYKAMIKDYNEERVSKYLKMANKKFSPELLSIEGISEEDFPTEGVTISYKFIKGPLDEIYTQTIDHFESFATGDSNSVEVHEIDPNKLKIRFRSYDALENYLNDRATLIGAAIESDLF